MEIDHYSDIQDLKPAVEQREELAIELILSRASSEASSFLDLGCGDGLVLSEIRRLKPSWTLCGFDLSPNQIAKAKRRVSGGHFSIGSLTEPLPYKDGSLDVIYSGEVIEHLTNCDLFLKEIRRTLKPSGILVVTTPNLFAWYNRILMLSGTSPLFVEYSTENSAIGYGPLKRFKASEKPVGHLRIFHPDALTDLLSYCGFEVTDLNAARFEYLPRQVRWLDDIVSELFTGCGSILVCCARKP